MNTENSLVRRFTVKPFHSSFTQLVHYWLLEEPKSSLLRTLTSLLSHELKRQLPLA